MHIWRRAEAEFFEHPGHFGGLEVSNVVSKAIGQNFVVQESKAPPGGGGESHYHENETQLFLVVKGELSFDTGSERFMLRSGEAVLFQPGEPHATLNEGGEESVSVVVTVDEREHTH